MLTRSFTECVQIIAFFGGIRGSDQLHGLFFLCFTTIAFGWVTEALSRPNPASRRPETNGAECHSKDSTEAIYAADPHSKWMLHAENPSVLVWGCAGPRLSAILAPLQRLGPHILGYIPYGAAWYTILNCYYWNKEQARQEYRRGPPPWVDAIVWGQLLLFSSFAVIQFLQQASDEFIYIVRPWPPFWTKVSLFGCRRYWWGECAYLIMSVVAKGMLGGILIANILLVGVDVDDLLLEEAGLQ